MQLIHITESENNMTKEIKSKLDTLQTSLDYLKTSFSYSDNESVHINILKKHSRQATIKAMQTILNSLKLES
jgi:hypothetical protein